MPIDSRAAGAKKWQNSSKLELSLETGKICNEIHKLASKLATGIDVDERVCVHA